MDTTPDHTTPAQEPAAEIATNAHLHIGHPGELIRGRPDQRTDGERELDAVVAITRALSGLPEGSRRKVLGTVEDYVQIPPRRARTAAGAAEGT